MIFPRYSTLRSDLSFCLDRPNDHALPWLYEYNIPEIRTGISTMRTVELFRGFKEHSQSLRAVIFYWIELTWPEIFEGSWIPVLLCPHMASCPRKIVRPKQSASNAVQKSGLASTQPETSVSTGLKSQSTWMSSCTQSPLTRTFGGGNFSMLCEVGNHLQNCQLKSRVLIW